jgi:glucose-1-phosphate thymidylyltransferase
MSKTIGIILAGGMGTRLSPITNAVNKHLLPIYNKPMIYYPLSLLILSGINDIILISDIESIKKFKDLFKNGSHLGISIRYLIQEKPNGIPECFLIAKKEIQNKKVVLILGDNFFFGQDFPGEVSEAINLNKRGCTFFGQNVSNPEKYAVVNFNKRKISITEKPKKPKTNIVIPGLYIFDKKVSYFASKLKKSRRGETEIVDLINYYTKKNNYTFKRIKRGITWIDMGSFDNLIMTNNFVKNYEERQNLMIGCIEEIAMRNGYISKNELNELSKNFNNEYGSYLCKISKEK